MTSPRVSAALVWFAVPVMFAAVTVEQGQLEGTAADGSGVRVYKGVPYAAAPVGDLRWKAPKAVPAWTGVREAKTFSPVCYQTSYPANSLYYTPPEQMSEDCLYLNVWTGAKSRKDKRPVMVWIHGGALTRGSGSTPVYDGENLAKKGVVLVTINYRLGLLGFYAHPELTKESDRNASGNYGLLDQLAAVEWVKHNIAAFGGDPNNITIFGESAGSWSVNYLTATPLAKGLFQKAIGESGGDFQVLKKLADVEQDGVKLAKTLNADSIVAMRAKSAKELTGRAENNTFGPNVDGYLLPQDVYTIFAQGKQNDVATLIGYNADEATSLAPWPASGTAKSFTDQQSKRFGSFADDFFKVYPAGSDEQAQASHYSSYRDFIFGWQMRTWAREQLKTGKSKVWMYYFAHRPPGPDSDRYRAYHASEIAYVFDNLLAPRTWEDSDRKLADEMSTYWVNFAAKGDPNGGGLPKWPDYREKTDNLMEFGDKPALANDVNKAGLDFWEGYFARARAPKN
jgi:para-nitrobenzyl esterase